MYVRSFSVQVNKWRLEWPNCFVDPTIPLFWPTWYISKMVQDRVIVRPTITVQTDSTDGRLTKVGGGQ